MRSKEFKDYNFYKHAMDGGEWYIFVFKVPLNKFFKSPYIGKYGKDDYVAFLGTFIVDQEKWEKAEKDEVFEDISKFVIKKIFS